MSGKQPTLGQLVSRARRAMGMTQTDLAERCGMTQGALSEIERGATRDVRISTAARLAEALNVSVACLTDPGHACQADSLLLELARRNAADERAAEEESEWHRLRRDSHKAMYYRGIAAGLRKAQASQLATVAEEKEANERPSEDLSGAV